MDSSSTSDNIANIARKRLIPVTAGTFVNCIHIVSSQGSGCVMSSAVFVTTSLDSKADQYDALDDELLSLLENDSIHCSDDERQPSPSPAPTQDARAQEREYSPVLDRATHASHEVGLQEVTGSALPCSTGDLTTLPPEALFRLLGFLSPEDLLSAAQTCTAFRALASDDLLWRRLHEARWQGSVSKQATIPQHGWKAMYLDRDHQEAAQAGDGAPEALKHIYVQMVTSQRSQRLGRQHAISLLAPKSACANDLLSRWRRAQGWDPSASWDPSTHDCSQGPSRFHTQAPAPGQAPPGSVPLSTAAGASALSLPLQTATYQPPKCQRAALPPSKRRRSLPSPSHVASRYSPTSSVAAAAAEVVPGQGRAGPGKFVQLSANVFACVACGWAHVCDEGCRERELCSRSDAMVCPISGRCFTRMLSGCEEDEAAETRGLAETADEHGDDFSNYGHLASAYVLGYSCNSEEELRRVCGVKLR